MKLKYNGSPVLGSEYHGFRGDLKIDLRAGETIDLPEEIAAGLLGDFPGVFTKDAAPVSSVPPVVQSFQVVTPPADRQVRSVRRGR